MEVKYDKAPKNRYGKPVKFDPKKQITDLFAPRKQAQADSEKK